MTKNGINLQDSFLNQIRKDNADVTLVLLDGSRLNGHVRGFDNFTVIVQNGTDQHLIYKHAIAQVIHQRTGREGGHERQPREDREHGHGHDRGHGPQGGEHRRPAQAKPAAEKGKFNTLDLSDVKIE